MQKPLVAYKLLYHSYPVLANIIDRFVPPGAFKKLYHRMASVADMGAKVRSEISPWLTMGEGKRGLASAFNRKVD